jgi:hypothetical protein
VFRIGDVTADSTGRGAIGAARDASVEIAGHLSSFYDAVFMNPDTWKNGVPDGAWQLFDPSVRARARQDSSSLTLGPAAANLESIRVKTTSLSIEVLADPRGKPQTAIANVEFEADGTLAGGQPVTATNKASFLFQISNGEWLVFGYPAASTTIEAGVPSPSAGRASAGTSPSATGTTP